MTRYEDLIMVDINQIQTKILALGSARFQKFCDAYLYEKFEWSNIKTLGTKEESDKTTKGTPDTFVDNGDETYTFIMYGTTDKKRIIAKLESDILDCINQDKIKIPLSKVREIICCHVSTNITAEVDQRLKRLAGNIKLTLIGLDVMSIDMQSPQFMFIARDYLDIPIGTNQIYTVQDFIEAYDKTATAAPLDVNFKFRSDLVKKIENELNINTAILVTGPSGVGKTKLSLEICHNFSQKNYTVLCVKSNGLGLYEDLRLMVSKSGHYLVFFDDVNDISDFKSIIALIKENKNPDIQIKILATVRDYAKAKVSHRISELGKFSEFSVPKFTDDEIKIILSENFKVFNPFIQKIIVKIAKGNVRLAVLASKLAEKNIYSLTNSLDIFKSYYGPIFCNEDISINAQKVLFVVALLQPLNPEDNTLFEQLQHYFEISDSDFASIVYDLHSKELLNRYENQVISISDQSFRDYVIYSALIEHRYISIEKLLQIGFKVQPVKIVSSINTILRLFGSQENVKYVTDQVNKRWESIPPDEEDNYLNSFFSLNRSKALDILENKISTSSTSDFKISYDFFIKNKNHHYIKSQEMNILKSYNKTYFLEEAICLSVQLLEKRPDYFMDLYFVMTNDFSYDEHALSESYEYQLKLFNTLISLRKTGNHNLDFLLIKISESLLQTNVSGIKPNEEGTAFTSYNLTLKLTKELESLREKIWSFLSQLYDEGLFQKEILRILATDIWTGYTDSIVSIIKFDVTCIINQFILKWKNPTNIEVFVLDHLMRRASKLNSNINIDKYEEIYTDLPSIRYFEILQEYYFNADFDARETLLKTKISYLVEKFETHDFKLLFAIASDIEKYADINPRIFGIIGNNLKIAIEKCNPTCQLEVLNIYFGLNAPFSNSCVSLIYNIFEFYDFKTIYDILASKNYSGKNIWLTAAFNNISENEINIETATVLRDFVFSQTASENPKIPFLNTIKRFSKYDKDIISFVTDKVCVLSAKDTKLANNFVCTYSQNPIELLNVFKENLGELENLYKSIDPQSFFDHQFTLLLALINRNHQYWGVYTKQLSNYKKNPKNLFNYIWAEEDYEEYIDVAFQNLITKPDGASIFYESYKELFPSESNPVVKKRIQFWIKSYIEKNINNSELIRKIFFYYISNDINDNKLCFISTFLKYNTTFDDFKNLQILPTYEAYSGSEIPLIDSQINFLKLLLNSDSLENKFRYKRFIMDQIKMMEDRKKAIKISEYQEEMLL